MTIQISRNGEVLGTYSRADIKQQISQGVLEPTDHFWREGMIEWKPLTTLDFYIPEKEERPNHPNQPVVQKTDIGQCVEKTRQLKVRGARWLMVGMFVLVIGAANRSELIMGIGTLFMMVGFLSFMMGRSRQ